MSCSNHAQSVCKVSFTDTGSTVLSVLHETHGGKLINLAFVN